jgi:hypothetical protein
LANPAHPDQVSTTASLIGLSARCARERSPAGLEADLFRHSRLVPTNFVLGPVLRQIKVDKPPAGSPRGWQATATPPPGNSPACQAVRNIGAHPNRMLSLLGKARVVDDHRLDPSMTLNLRQHHLAHLAQHGCIRPAALTDKMQQRLMLCRSSPGSRDRGHRLNALALDRHHQAGAIIAQRPTPIRVPDHAHKSAT